MKIAIKELRQLAEEALQKQGYNEAETKVIADVLMFAQLRGSNQGIVKLIGRGIPKKADARPATIVKETPISALIDSHNTHGMLVLDQAVEMAIAKAKKSGIGMVGNFNSSESTGALGYYSKKIADQGLIGITYASAPFKTTAPHGSNQPMFCTNPMAYGIPTEGEPIILDMSTSAIAYYGLIEAKTAGKTLAAGLGYNKEGVETQNAAEIMDGAIKTFGGHKGSGLALIVQIFAGALVQADSFNDDSVNSGNLVMAIDPEILTTRAAFTKEVSSIIKRIKSARRIDEKQEIRIPGERSSSIFAKAIESGEIEVEDNLLSELKKTAS